MRGQKTRAIHQLVPVLNFGDGVGNHVRWVCDCLRGLGYQSEIYTEGASPLLIDQVKLLHQQSIPPDDAVIYHHCTGTRLTEMMSRHPGPKTMIYHNITPPEFFASSHPALAASLREARDGLPLLAPDYEVAYGDSDYNADELRNAGFKDCRPLPIPVFPDRFEAADPDLLADLDDGLTNLLFVGRVVPHKSQHQLVEAFYHYLCMDPKARLILTGFADLDDPYVRLVQSRIDALGIRSRILMFGHVSEAKLHALYRSADLLWSMSEHEGFCLPLLEAMWKDVPVLAYKSSAVPETLGDAGVIFDDKSDLRAVAAVAKLLVQDQGLRAAVLAAQERRRVEFLPSVIRPQIAALAERLVGP